MSQHDDLLTSAETAALLSIKTNTLEIWRNKGKGPAFVKLGEAPQAPVRYVRSVVLDWLAKRSFGSTSDYSPAGMLNRTPDGCRSSGASA